MPKRRIPTDTEWFDYRKYKFAGWLFCFLSSSAKFHERLYYPKSKLVTDFPYIKKLLEVRDKRTINKYINILLENGYLSEDNNNYYFPFEFNNGTYILIDKDLLYNLCVTKSALTIQIFIYLSSKMNMKKAIYSETTYNFTLKELRIALGYSADSQNAKIESLIRECIQSLKAENYIDYKQVYVDVITNKGNCRIPNYVLTNVCDKLPQTIARIKEEEERVSKENYSNCECAGKFHF